MNWARLLLGWRSACKTLPACAENAPVSREASASMPLSTLMEASEPNFSAYRRPKSGATPAWCKKAFKFERSRFGKERSDWGFIAPVWILMGMVCIVSQVAALHWAYSALV